MHQLTIKNRDFTIGDPEIIKKIVDEDIKFIQYLFLKDGCDDLTVVALSSLQKKYKSQLKIQTSKSRVFTHLPLILDEYVGCKADVFIERFNPTDTEIFRIKISGIMLNKRSVNNKPPYISNSKRVVVPRSFINNNPEAFGGVRFVKIHINSQYLDVNFLAIELLTSNDKSEHVYGLNKFKSGLITQSLAIVNELLEIAYNISLNDCKFLNTIQDGDNNFLIFKAEPNG